MQVIGQNNDGLEGEWSASAGHLEHLPKILNVFDQEFFPSFPSCTWERNYFGIVGAHPRVRPQFRVDTWVCPYMKMVVCLELLLDSFHLESL